MNGTAAFDGGIGNTRGGLVNWWAGDNHALDYIGTNHGTLLNGATYRPGRVDYAFAFDGTNDAVDVGAMPWLGGAKEFTALAWIHRTNVANRFGGIEFDAVIRIICFGHQRHVKSGMPAD